MKWYKYDIRDLSETEFEKWYSLMSEDKKKRVDGFRFDDDKKRTVAGEMLVRKAIAQWCGIKVEDIIFIVKEHGKPYAQGLHLDFNISHSGDMVVCAIDEKPIGIDIEKIAPIDLKIAKRIFTDDELLYLFSHIPDVSEFEYTTDTEVLIRFFELWTAKEAYVKCTGVGIADIKSKIDKSHIQNFSFGDYIVSIYS